jgi:hypothetical protein
VELAAVDLLLRQCRNFTNEQAIVWIEDNFGADRSTVIRSRQMCDGRYNKEATSPLMEAYGCDDLLSLSGSLYRYVKRALPECCKTRHRFCHTVAGRITS